MERTRLGAEEEPPKKKTKRFKDSKGKNGKGDKKGDQRSKEERTKPRDQLQAVVDAIPSLGFYYTTDAAELALIEELTSPVLGIVLKYQTKSQSIIATANAKARDEAVELGICEGDIVLEDDFS